MTHKADSALAGVVLDAALDEDHPAVMADLAGALEESLGLAGAAARVRARISGLDAAGQRRATTLLGWLLDTQSVDRIAADLRGGDVARACRAADALGDMAAAQALPALQGLASDGGSDRRCRQHALRAIGRIGGVPGTRFLTEATQALETPELRQDARFARDFAASWTLR